MLSINDTDRQVAALLKSKGIKFSVHYTHFDRDSQMDKFIITFTGFKSETFDYMMGTGHRVDTSKSYPYNRLNHKQLKALKDLRNLIDQKTVSFPLDGSPNSSQLAVAPTQASVLYCLLSDIDCGADTFQDFCDNLGYDSDSMSAHKIYLACQENGHKLRNVLNNNTIEQLQELLQDY